MADVEFKGGEKLKEFFDNVGKGGVKGIEVGVFASAKYPDGTPVASVATWNEYGTRHIPERPALRTANKENEKAVTNIIKRSTDPQKMVVTERIANLIGASHQAAMQQSIIKWRSPANAPSTIEAKDSSNPLIDTGLYRNSITYKVIQ